MYNRVSETSKSVNGSKKSRMLYGIFRKLLKTKKGLFGFIVVGLLLVIAVFAPLLTPHNPYELRMDRVMKLPSWEHPLGTDQFGRDTLSRIIYGARISMLVGLSSVFAGLILGSLAGLIAGFYGSKVDAIIMRLVEVVWVFPRVLLALLIIAVIGPSLGGVIFVIALGSLPAYARIIRGNVLSVKEMEYVMAAKALGAGDLRIMLRHILPNVIAPVIVVGTLYLGYAIMLEATMSFLGLGVQPPTPSWGLMITQGRSYMRTYPLLTIFPGLAIMLTVFGFNLLGDVLRDILDPRLKKLVRF